VEFDIEDMETELEKLKINKKVQELSQNSPTVECRDKRAESAVKSAEQALSDAEKKYEDSKNFLKHRQYQKVNWIWLKMP